MSANYKRITLKELRPIMEFYHSHFPTWRIVGNDTLVREIPPILQGVTFERLSYGVYRPIGHIRVLVAPEPHWGFDLPQDLNVKLRTIDRRRHEHVRARVVEAMRAEFVPAIDRPLVAEEVLDLYEERAHPTEMQAYSLAALNAYLGHDERALSWCNRFRELMDRPSGSQHARYQQEIEFLDQLEIWLQAGNAREQLEQVLQHERCKWKLA